MRIAIMTLTIMLSTVSSYRANAQEVMQHWRNITKVYISLLRLSQYQGANQPPNDVIIHGVGMIESLMALALSHPRQGPILARQLASDLETSGLSSAKILAAILQSGIHAINTSVQNWLLSSIKESGDILQSNIDEHLTGVLQLTGYERRLNHEKALLDCAQVTLDTTLQEYSTFAHIPQQSLFNLLVMLFQIFEGEMRTPTIHALSPTSASSIANELAKSRDSATNQDEERRNALHQAIAGFLSKRLSPAIAFRQIRLQLQAMARINQTASSRVRSILETNQESTLSDDVQEVWQQVDGLLMLEEASARIVAAKLLASIELNENDYTHMRSAELFHDGLRMSALGREIQIGDGEDIRQIVRVKIGASTNMQAILASLQINDEVKSIPWMVSLSVTNRTAPYSEKQRVSMVNDMATSAQGLLDSLGLNANLQLPSLPVLIQGLKTLPLPTVPIQ